MKLRPRKNIQLQSTAPYPDGQPQDALQELVAELDKEAFTTRELLGTDDKLVHGLMSSKKDTSTKQRIQSMTFMNDMHIQRIAGYIIARVYRQNFKPSPSYSDYLSRAEHSWEKIREETGDYFDESERRPFIHLLVRYALLHHDTSLVKVKKIEYGGSNQFGIAARRFITKNEYIYECHGVTTKDAANKSISALSIITRAKQGRKGKQTYNVIMAGPGRLINHHCNPNALLVSIEDNASAFALQAMRDIKMDEEIYIDYGEDYWTPESPCLCSAHSMPQPTVRQDAMDDVQYATDDIQDAADDGKDAADDVQDATDDGKGAVNEARYKRTGKRKRSKNKVGRRGGAHRIKPEKVKIWKESRGLVVTS